MSQEAVCCKGGDEGEMGLDHALIRSQKWTSLCMRGMLRTMSLSRASGAMTESDVIHVYVRERGLTTIQATSELGRDMDIAKASNIFLISFPIALPLSLASRMSR